MRPQFTVVSAIYNVAPYIEEFLASLDRQTYGVENLELILIDDGSTDGSGEIAQRWARSSAARVTVLHQENAGQGAARNAGIEIATGEWVTFADPDDVLADTYFAEVATFLAEERRTPVLLATRQLTFTDDHMKHTDRHPLRKNYQSHNQLVDLSRFPERIHLSGCSAFLPLDRLKTSSIRFDSRIRPTFEDGHFIGVSLLASAVPLVGFLRTAEYYYRKRVDGSSSVQAGWAKEEKYTHVPRYGYLDLVRRAMERYGRVPTWLQNTVLYDLLWYFKNDARATALTGAIPAAALEEFHEICTEIFAHIDVETILGFRVSHTADWFKHALIAGYVDREKRPTYVRIDTLDTRRRLVRARYTYSGTPPTEAFFWRGQRIQPVYAKVRAVELLGRALQYERIVWLPANGTLRVDLDGRPQALALRSPQDLPYSLTTAEVQSELVGRRAVKAAQPPRRGGRAQVRHALAAPRRWSAALQQQADTWRDGAERTARRAVREAATPAVRKRFADAWVLMDRQDQAQDNAEHLYRYLRAEQPKVNTWFVLERMSADWARLEGEGFRLVAYGSFEWRLLLLNARHVISSHANAFVIAPLPERLYGPPPWKFTFLQHGITKDDLSRWLNPKPIDLIVTSTAPEQASFVGDGTPYRFTAGEVQRTGFPRHDALLRRAAELSPGDVDRILVMPTWRRALTDALPGSLTLEQRRAVVRESDYVQKWFAALAAPELEALAARTGSRVTFMPHPNMAAYLEPGDLPSHVDVLSWDTVDVQDVFARTRILVTDYSSVGFEVAMLGRPVVYYQFDEGSFFSGAQPYRRGYFEYRRDGFGPVVESHDEMLAAVEEIETAGFHPGGEYAQRMQRTFGEPDMEACRRTYEAVRALDRPVRARVVEVGGVPGEAARQDVADAAATVSVLPAPRLAEEDDALRRLDEDDADPVAEPA